MIKATPSQIELLKQAILSETDEILPNLYIHVMANDRVNELFQLWLEENDYSEERHIVNDIVDMVKEINRSKV